jgi:hypothetical protein
MKAGIDYVQDGAFFKAVDTDIRVWQAGILTRDETLQLPLEYKCELEPRYAA